jgi:hypothetical protein
MALDPICLLASCFPNPIGKTEWTVAGHLIYLQYRHQFQDCKLKASKSWTGNE